MSIDLHTLNVSAVPKILCAFLLVIAGCGTKKNGAVTEKNTPAKNGTVTIAVQPFYNISTEDSLQIINQLSGVYNARIIFNRPAHLPQKAFYKPRGRYIADSLLQFLLPVTDDSYVLGITDADISTKKGNIANWGIMGYGYQPGKSCVISGYRVYKTKYSSRKNCQRLLKVALHELGHNFGLPHCSYNSCFMVDAEGGDKLESEKGFCTNCSQFLRQRHFIN